MIRNRRRVKKGEVVLRAVRPSAGFQAEYRRRLDDLVRAMHESVDYLLKRVYRKNPPEIAQDAEPEPEPNVEMQYLGGERPWAAYLDGEPLRSKKTGAIRRFATAEAAKRAAYIVAGRELPADELRAAMQDLSARWLSQFDEASQRVADWFAKGVSARSDAQLRSILRQGGFTVRFQQTQAQKDIIAATLNQNVSLIRSIPQKYLTEVEGMVMRSVQVGRDLGTLSKDLQREFGVTKRRAALIARDQNNKATSAMTRARQVELGITEAIWLHSHGGKKPRPKHLAADGKRYDVTKGLPIGDKGQYVFPGEEINCRCVSRSIVPGFS